jgi:hypothetical protein
VCIVTTLQTALAWEDWMLSEWKLWDDINDEDKLSSSGGSNSKEDIEIRSKALYAPCFECSAIDLRKIKDIMLSDGFMEANSGTRGSDAEASESKRKVIHI